MGMVECNGMYMVYDSLVKEKWAGSKERKSTTHTLMCWTFCWEFVDMYLRRLSIQDGSRERMMLWNIRKRGEGQIKSCHAPKKSHSESLTQIYGRISFHTGRSSGGSCPTRDRTRGNSSAGLRAYSYHLICWRSYENLLLLMSIGNLQGLKKMSLLGWER